MPLSTNILSNKPKDVVDILGLPVNPLTMHELIRLADQSITTRRQLLLGVVNAAKLVNARRNPGLRQSLERADVILADGMSIVWLSKLMGLGLSQRVAGIDIMYSLLELASKKRYHVFFLGAKPHVVKKVVEIAQNSYAGLCVAGFRDGYFDKNEEENIAKKIRNSNADILFVAMSSPKKENFLEKWHTFMRVPICHGVGGSFDVVAGVTKRAPIWMQKFALEWLYRLIQEPRRMWKRYLVTNTIFIVLSLWVIIRARLTRLCQNLPMNSVFNTKRLK